MVELPIDSHLPGICKALRDTANMVIVADPGAGKTTRVPPAIIRSQLLSNEHPHLVMLQPRRVAARAAAMRIADENNFSLGKEVGWHVRFDRKISRDTRIRVLTEGILTRQLVDDPYLEGIGAVILDEFHERSIHTDLAIALLREIQQTVRPDLKLIVMSATLDAEPIARFLSPCTIQRVPGRVFPVEISYRTPDGSQVWDRVWREVSRAIDEHPQGDVLVFLPGVFEIQRCIETLKPLQERNDLLLLPLHGSLDVEEQMRAIRPADRRKIILATNVAETSLTIDGVRVVIDSGLARVAGFDPQRGMDRLDLKQISQASAKQRAGRAGRTSAGWCVRLWSDKQQHAMDEFERPEVQRVDLAATILSLHSWGREDPRGFGWFETPDEKLLQAAERLLAMLGALDADKNGKITPLGRQMLTLPTHPRIARLLIDAHAHGLDEEGSLIAAMLSEPDFVNLRREDAPTQGNSDLLWRLHLIEQQRKPHFVSQAALSQVLRTQKELSRLASLVSRASGPSRGKHMHGPETRDTESLLLKLALLAYPDRVCKRRENDPTLGTMVGGSGVKLADESCVRKGAFFVAIDARSDHRAQNQQAMVRQASSVEVQWLSELFPQSVRKSREVVFDESSQKAMARTRTLYMDLILAEHSEPAARDEVGNMLGTILAPQAVEIFSKDQDASQLLARVALLRDAMAEHAFPAFDDVMLREILAEACVGKRSREQITSHVLCEAIQSRLMYPLDRLLEQHAPTSIAVPTGNRIKLQYQVGKPPVLAVRLQELFGLAATPTIAGGRVKVLLHLLGPNYRPVQITEDLASFWKSAYFQVRKDLKARYPKHSWPEDPTTAPPVAKGRSWK